MGLKQWYHLDMKTKSSFQPVVQDGTIDRIELISTYAATKPECETTTSVLADHNGNGANANCSNQEPCLRGLNCDEAAITSEDPTSGGMVPPGYGTGEDTTHDDSTISAEDSKLNVEATDFVPADHRGNEAHANCPIDSSTLSVEAREFVPRNNAEFPPTGVARSVPSGFTSHPESEFHNRPVLHLQSILLHRPESHLIPMFVHEPESNLTPEFYQRPVSPSFPRFQANPRDSARPPAYHGDHQAYMQQGNANMVGTFQSHWSTQC
ncbi:hypothetical protein OS493_004612 [Desmophyllum pertusum]|uniref:Uncharacterized protein n=1 Tax=Desmophyllum pertusum TaxID=174260 RepID=A0A9W9ZG17_9CNID|nr:hypothetical protein OS493_004612 [Desmophyllum pertusum]